MKSIALSVSLFLAASAASAQDGTWTQRATMPFTYQFGATASDGSYLYTFGGFGTPYATYRYDPVAASWLRLADLPFYNQGGPTGAAYGGAVFCFGVSGTGVGVVHRYDVGAGTWAQLPASTGHGIQGAVATLGSKAYLTGGSSGGNQVLCTEFDMVTFAVRSLEPVPYAISRHASIGIGGKVYLIGGVGRLDLCYEFDPGAGSLGRWRARAGLPFGLDAPAACVVGDRIYLTGGILASGLTSTATLEYAPFRNTWRQRADMLMTRYGHGSGTAANRPFVVGGRGAPAQQVDEFGPPDLGSRPNDAADVQQGVAPGGWVGRRVTFSALLSDPDAGQQLRLEVQVKPVGTARWEDAVQVESALQAQGRVELDYDLPAEGDYDWRYRVSDENDLIAPQVGGLPGWTEFSPASPDLRCDPVDPGAVVPLAPLQEVAIPQLDGGEVTFLWQAAEDNATAVTYEIEVLRDGTPAASAAGVEGTRAALRLATGSHSWRIRARDGAGNAGPWSDLAVFGVRYESATNRSGGDAARACGLSAGPAGNFPVLGLLLVLLGLGLRRRPV